eukprot:5537394-Amphidinium_carterae.1
MSDSQYYSAVCVICFRQFRSIITERSANRHSSEARNTSQQPSRYHNKHNIATRQTVSKGETKFQSALETAWSYEQSFSSIWVQTGF